MGGRLVEDEDRCRLGNRHARRRRAAARRARGARASRSRRWPTPTRSIAGSTAIPIRRRASRRSAVRAASDRGRRLRDCHRERQLGELGDDGDRSRHRLAVDRRSACRRQRYGPAARRGERRSAPAAGSTCRRRWDRPGRAFRRPRAPGRHPLTIARSPSATVTPYAPTDRRSQLVPRSAPIQQDEEEWRTEHRHDDADRDVAEHPGDEVGGGQQDRAGDRRERDHPSCGRPTRSRTTCGTTSPTKPMRPADGHRGGGRHRGHDEQDPAFAPDVHPEVARRGIAEEQAVERTCPPRDGGATGQDEWRRDEETVHDAPARPPSRNVKIARRFAPDTYIAIVRKRREDRPDGIAGEQQPGHPARRADAAEPEDKERGGDGADEREHVESPNSRAANPTGSTIAIAAPERRARRRPEHVRVGERVSHDALERRPGHRQPGPDDISRQNARQAKIPDDRLGRGGPGLAQVEAERRCRMTPSVSAGPIWTEPIATPATSSTPRSTSPTTPRRSPGGRGTGRCQPTRRRPRGIVRPSRLAARCRRESEVRVHRQGQVVHPRRRVVAQAA